MLGVPNENKAHLLEGTELWFNVLLKSNGVFLMNLLANEKKSL